MHMAALTMGPLWPAPSPAGWGDPLSTDWALGEQTVAAMQRNGSFRDAIYRIKAHLQGSGQASVQDPIHWVGVRA